MKSYPTSDAFILHCRHHYEQMLTDIEHCRKKELGAIAEIECCFQMAEKYWALIRYDLADHQFETTAQEIKFFKEVKPLFVSEAEYYGLRYHAALFRRDVHDPAELEKFWQREALRLRRFEQEQQDFVVYWRSGRTDLDELYFVRSNEALELSHRNADLDYKITTAYDPFVSTLKSLERYHKDVLDFIKAG